MECKIYICRNGGRIRLPGLVIHNDSDTFQRSYQMCAFGKWLLSRFFTHFNLCGCIYYKYISFTLCSLFKWRGISRTPFVRLMNKDFKYLWLRWSTKGTIFISFSPIKHTIKNTLIFVENLDPPLRGLNTHYNTERPKLETGE